MAKVMPGVWMLTNRWRPDGESVAPQNSKPPVVVGNDGRLPRQGLVDDHVVLGEDDRSSPGVDADHPSAESPHAVDDEPPTVLAQHRATPWARRDVVGVVGQVLALRHEQRGERRAITRPPATEIERPHHPLADRAAAGVDEVDEPPVVPASLAAAEDRGPLGLALQERSRPPGPLAGDGWPKLVGWLVAPPH
jgi:hypothetical protein